MNKMQPLRLMAAKENPTSNPNLWIDIFVYIMFSTCSLLIPNMVTCSQYENTFPMSLLPLYYNNRGASKGHYIKCYNHIMGGF